MGRFFLFPTLCITAIFSSGCGQNHDSAQIDSCDATATAAQVRAVKVTSEVFSRDYKKMIVSRKSAGVRGSAVEVVDVGDESQRLDRIQQWMHDEDVDFVEPDYQIEIEESQQTDDH
jgi:hypothetical protein